MGLFTNNWDFLVFPIGTTWDNISNDEHKWRSLSHGGDELGIPHEIRDPYRAKLWR